MTAEEYLDKVRINEIPYNIIMFKPIEVIQMLQDFARLKCKSRGKNVQGNGTNVLMTVIDTNITKKF
jgi:hypothetical protein